ncbi:hypothetical protein M0805_003556 [Coniferiporia weirii]|nr:hypothetical protein M0805_003556 [Coniferiporia weirii]
MAPRRRANCQICSAVESKYACPKCGVLYCSVACYKDHKSTSCKDQTTSTPLQPPNTTQKASANDELGGNEASNGTGSTSDLAHTPPVLYEPTHPHYDQSSPSPPGRAAGVSGGLDSNDENGHLGGGDGNSEPKPGPSGAGEVPSLPPLEPARQLRKLSSLKWPYVPDTSSYPDPLTRDDPKPLNLTQYEAIATSPAVRRVLATHARLPTLLRSIDQLRGPNRETAFQRVLGIAPAQANVFSLAGVPASSSPLAGYIEGIGMDVDEEDMNALRALAEAVEGAVRGSGQRPDPLGLDWESMAP